MSQPVASGHLYALMSSLGGTATSRSASRSRTSSGSLPGMVALVMTQTVEL